MNAQIFIELNEERCYLDVEIRFVVGAVYKTKLPGWRDQIDVLLSDDSCEN